MGEITEVCGYIFLGTDQKRHRCTLEDYHDGRCYCAEFEVGARDRDSDHYYRRAFQRKPLAEERVLQDWIERHEQRKYPS